MIMMSTMCIIIKFVNVPPSYPPSFRILLRLTSQIHNQYNHLTNLHNQISKSAHISSLSTSLHRLPTIPPLAFTSMLRPIPLLPHVHSTWPAHRRNHPATASTPIHHKNSRHAHHKRSMRSMQTTACGNLITCDAMLLYHVTRRLRGPARRMHLGT